MKGFFITSRSVRRPKGHLKKVKALIIDAPIASQLLIRMLSSYSQIEIIGVVQNGREAIERIRNDSPDLVFQDLTDWSIVQTSGAPDYRYNDREIVRAFADHCTATFEWLVAHGVVFMDKAPDNLGGSSIGNSVPREMHPLNTKQVEVFRTLREALAFLGIEELS